MISMESFPIPADSVVARIINGEAVIVLPDNGQVKVINEVGARIWELIDGKLTIRQISEVIYDEYEIDQEQAGRHTLEFICSLEESGIVANSSTPIL